MNTMIYSKTGTSTGIGFAVPVDTIKKIVPQIIKYGKVLRPGLGISLLSDTYTRRLDIKGAIVFRVPTDSAAHRLGIRGIGRNRYGELYIRDIIVGIDNHKISSYDDLYNTLDNYKAGEIVTLTLQRNGKERKLRFPLVRID
jgi:S1-C subfamily serine protease